MDNNQYNENEYYYDEQVGGVVNEASQEAYYDPNQDPNQQQAGYDQYYGGSSMEYNADQIYNYEQAYDANNYDYSNYYNSYYQNDAQQAMNDARIHQEQYQYYLAHKDEMRQYFPKKKKIIRWEELDANYNSLEAAEEFMDLLAQIQESNVTDTSNTSYSDTVEDYSY